MAFFIKFLVLSGFLTLPLFRVKKRRQKSAPARNIANERSDFGVSEDGDIVVMDKEEEGKI